MLEKRQSGSSPAPQTGERLFLRFLFFLHLVMLDRVVCVRHRLVRWPSLFRALRTQALFI